VAFGSISAPRTARFGPPKTKCGVGARLGLETGLDGRTLGLLTRETDASGMTKPRR